MNRKPGLLVLFALALAIALFLKQPSSFTKEASSNTAPEFKPVLAEATAIDQNDLPDPADARPARSSRASDLEFVPHQLLIQFRENSSNTEQVQILKTLNATISKRLGPDGRMILVQLPPTLGTEEAQLRIADNPAVDAVEKNFVYYASRTPNDPRFGFQWSFNNLGARDGVRDIDIDAPEAWSKTTGSKDVVIGVIDSGVHLESTDLLPNLWRNPGEVPDNGLDDDANGWIDDVYGIDVVNSDGSPEDNDNHGTNVTGVIAAAGNNSIGISGVMWDTNVISCKFIGDDGYGTTSGAIQCLDYFAALKDRGVNIVATNNSWGGGGYSALLQSAIERHRARGIIFVASAGNDDADIDQDPLYPAAMPNSNILSVAAIDRLGKLASFSNYGRNAVDIAAPGVYIISTNRYDSYDYSHGTSMAAPHVTGAIGLIKANEPTMSVDAIFDRLRSSVTQTDELRNTTRWGGFLRIRLPFIDSDGDGMSDSFELFYAFNPNDAADGAQDADSDGLTNLQEFQLKTDPRVVDTDEDGLSDGAEVNTYGTDPLFADTDNDGLFDGVEVNVHGTDPLSADTDGDGLTDFDELNQLGTDPTDPDSDADGLPDGWELEFGYNPLSPDDAPTDEDGDGLSVVQEYQNGTNPRLADTDADGLSDFEEITNTSTNPNKADTDGDFMDDGWELEYGFDPNNGADGEADADGDGFSNVDEFHGRSDPNDATAIPPLNGWQMSGANARRSGSVEFASSVGNNFVRWSRPGFRVRESVSSDGRLFLIPEDPDEGSIVALDMLDGSELFTKTGIDVASIASPVVAGDNLLFVEYPIFSDGRILGVDLQTGEDSVRIDLVSPYRSFKIVADKGLVYVMDDGELKSFDPESGLPGWSASDPTGGGGVPALSSEHVAVFGSKLTVWDRETGEPLFSRNASNCPRSQPSYRFSIVQFDQQGDLYTSPGSCVKKIDIATRQIVWQTVLGSSVPAPMIGEQVVVVQLEGSWAGLSPETGEVIWSNSGIANDSYPILTSTHLIISSEHEQTTWFYDALTGQLEGTVPVGASRKIVTNDGALVLFGPDEIVAIDISVDTDADGMADWWERRHFLQLADAADASLDTDNDGITNLEEFTAKTNPRVQDTDADGLTDYQELVELNTDPLEADTDGDGLDDGLEVERYFTDPFVADSDGDHASDGTEVHVYRTDPSDQQSRPDIIYSYRQSFEHGLPDDFQVVGNNSWEIVRGHSTDGDYAIRPTAMKEAETSVLVWTGLFAEGHLRFDALLNYAGYSELTVYVDAQRIELDDTTSHSIAITPGEHEIRWEYTRQYDDLNGIGGIFLDNLRFETTRPLGSGAGNMLAFYDGTLMELTTEGDFVGAPNVNYPAITPRSLLMSSRHDIVIGASYSNLVFYDPSANNSLTVGTTNVRTTSLCEAGGFLVMANTGGSGGLARFTLSGESVDAVLAGTEYSDLALGDDGLLYGSVMNSGQIDRIDPTTFQIVSSVDIGSSASSIAVDTDGYIYASRMLSASKYDTAGGLVAELALPDPTFATSSLLDSEGNLIIAGERMILRVAADFSSSREIFQIFKLYSVPVYITRVNRAGIDSDSDGLPDWWEQWRGFDPADPADASSDPDNDGLDGLAEFQIDTNPRLADTDNDGLSDAAERDTYGTDPRRNDTDYDGLSDYDELLTHNSNPLMSDSDGDGIDDYAEALVYETDPAQIDTDGDGLSDALEIELGFDPNDNADASADFDEDGLSNLEEHTRGTSATRSDTDNDDVSDGDEVNLHMTDPLNRDSDGDRISDGWEIEYGFDPLAANDPTLDSDSDRFTDLQEFFAGSSPLDASSTPSLTAWHAHSGSSANTAYVPILLEPGNIQTIWEATVPDSRPNRRPVAAADGVVWITFDNYGSVMGPRLVALSAASGAIIWDKNFPAATDINTPALAGDLVLVETNAAVSGVSKSTGEVAFSTPTSRRVYRDLSALPFGSEFYISDGSNDGLAAYSLLGDKIWSRDLRSRLSRAPAVDDLAIYFQSDAGFQALDRRSGENLFTIYTPRHDQRSPSSSLPPVLGPDKTAYSSDNRRLMAFDLRSQSLLWVKEQITGHYMALANGVLFTIDQGDVVALDTRDGSEIWRVPGLHSGVNSIIATAGHLILADSLRTVALNSTDGSEVWRLERGGQLSLSNDGILYIARSFTDPELVAVRLFGDADVDGMPDSWEQQMGLDPDDPTDATLDPDGDGLENLQEYQSGTDLNNADSDGDGLSDGEEVVIVGSDPRTVDTDGDSLSDFEEHNQYNTNPLLVDSDGDRLFDQEELFDHLTDPLLVDTDNDSFDDFLEVQYATDSRDPDSVPPLLTDYSESFEAGSLPLGWYTPDGVVQTWRITSGDALDGNYKLQADPIEYYESAVIEFIGRLPAGRLKISANAFGGTGNQATVYVDGEYRGQLNTNNWAESFVNIEAGTKRIRFELTRHMHSGEAEFSMDSLQLLPPDRDGDQMPDAWEEQFGLDPNNASDAYLDLDNDRLSNLHEFLHGTSPIDMDTDNDGMSDGWELSYELDPLANDAAADQDTDGLSNLREFSHGTNPNRTDTDSDGMPDGWEVEHNLDPLDNDALGDPDGDGVDNLQEYNDGTDPNVAQVPAPSPPPSSGGGGGGGGGALHPLGLLVISVLSFGAALRRRRLSAVLAAGAAGSQ